MNFHIVCEFRENDFSSKKRKFDVSDRPRASTIRDFCDTVNALGHTCTIFGGINELVHAFDNKTSMPKGIYINFNDGLRGEFGRVQAPILLDLLDVPYANSNPFVSALLNNKHYTKVIANHYGAKTPKGYLVRKGESFDIVLEQLSCLKFPIIAKPNNEGSSVGVTQQSVCSCVEEAKAQMDALFAEFDEVIIEEYISGYEITNLLFGNQTNISYCDSIAFMLDKETFFYKEVMGANEKTNKLRKSLLADSVLSHAIVHKIEKLSCKLMILFDINDLARFDYRVRESGEIYLLEINSLPRLGRDSDLGFLCSARSISYSAQIDSYLNGIMQRLNYTS